MRRVKIMDKRDTNNQIIIYKTVGGDAKIEVRLEGETVWLSQKQMAELFDCSVDNVGLHLKNIYLEGELEEISTAEDSSVVQVEAGRSVNRPVKFYNLDAIISVGYRVNSLRGTQFRIWATQKLREYIIKGFAMDDERLAEGRVKKTYFEEWEERIRKIRTSEANFYQKVRDVFATSADYDPKTDYAQLFYATVQNKFHYAITGSTAAEIVSSRANSAKANMGLTNWKGAIITRQQAEIAKNYLEELELKRLNLLVEQFLSFAELQTVEQRVMYMKDWIQKLDDFLVLNDKEILQNAGNVSHLEMEKKVRKELEKYNRQKLKDK
ncbi:MAG: virulence RhuM family protein [Candidatus Yanofskyibacterium parasiticum]|nr:MAG: virulence RhuM family protein [Candidatus Yanofskybacteria bacterium]